jgi:hypothetical protein
VDSGTRPTDYLLEASLIEARFISVDAGFAFQTTITGTLAPSCPDLLFFIAVYDVW